MDYVDTKNLSDAEVREALELIEAINRAESQRAIGKIFPDKGKYRRELYPKHMQFFKNGVESRERCFLAANRVGKTVGGGAETNYHATGEYPDWWEGRRFDGPIDSWVAGDTRQTTRDIQQLTLLGKPGDHGTGLIPKASILKTTPKSGVPDAVETVYIKRKKGGTSVIGFKSYDQGRKSFQGTAKHVVWLDEECPIDVYDECLIRTMTCQGIIMLTFTPLDGLTPVVLSFLPGGELKEHTGKKAVVMASWDDVPHLSAQDKAELLASCLPHQRKARSQGIPSIGSGAIYPVEEESFVVEPFKIPPHWPRAYGFDVGWNNTAALWGAHDRESDTVYLYSEYKRGQVEPPIHASAIKARGLWVPGVIDPASAGSGQLDGKKLITAYKDEGLLLSKADNAVEAGIFEVYRRLSTGRLKVFSNLGGFLEEIRLYRRDKNGKIVKDFDHLQDCCRYLVMSGLRKARCQPIEQSFIPRTNNIGDSAVGY